MNGTSMARELEPRAAFSNHSCAPQLRHRADRQPDLDCLPARHCWPAEEITFNYGRLGDLPCIRVVCGRAPAARLHRLGGILPPRLRGRSGARIFQAHLTGRVGISSVLRKRAANNTNDRGSEPAGGRGKMASAAAVSESGNLLCRPMAIGRVSKCSQRARRPFARHPARTRLRYGRLSICATGF